MEWKQIDPKSFANLVAFALATGVIVALIGWALVSIEQIQTVESPIERTIQQEGLLD